MRRLELRLLPLGLPCCPTPHSTVKHLGAEQFSVDLLQPAAEQVLAREDNIWIVAFKPILADVPSAGVIELAIWGGSLT